MTDLFKKAREEFPALDKTVYLNWAGTGPMPAGSVRAVEELINAMHKLGGASLAEMRHKIPVEAKKELGNLLNASIENIAVTGTSTTQGVQSAFNAINPKKGDEIVTCDLQYVLSEVELQKWRNRGVEIKVVKNRGGTYSQEDFSGAIGKKTSVVFLDSVTWINGFKFEVPEVAKIAHENDAIMLTDSIQHVGQATLDTRKFGADIIAGSAQKWLSDMLGVGYTYVSSEIVERLERPYYGYNNTVEPEGGWPAYFADIDRPVFSNFTFSPDPSSMLEYGGSLANLGGLAALAPSLRLINGIGISNIEKRVLELKKVLIEGLEDLRMNIHEPHDRKHQTGITTFETGRGREFDRKVVEKLAKRGITVSYRAGSGIGGIRISTHYVNNETDIGRVIEALREENSRQS